MLRILYVGPLWVGPPPSSGNGRFAASDIGLSALIASRPQVQRSRVVCCPEFTIDSQGQGSFLVKAAFPTGRERTGNLWRGFSRTGSISCGWTRHCRFSGATLAEAKRRQPECRIVGYCCDDLLNPGNQSPQFLKHLPLYDAFFTTKTYNVGELRALGCRRPLLIGNSYDPATHRPMEVSPAERDLYGGEVGFIGAWEAERAETFVLPCRRMASGSEFGVAAGINFGAGMKGS